MNQKDGVFKRFFEHLSNFECRLARMWVRSAHRRLLCVQWHHPPQPEHFDHHIDLYAQFLDLRNSQWLERGVFGGLTLNGGTVLELACGDGFNARNFYSLRSKHVTACDFDPRAIKTAKLKNKAPNVTFLLADIRHTMPKGDFDTVIWDTAIEHFTQEEINLILQNIKRRLQARNGILSGHTIVEKESGEKSLSHHEYEFKSKEELKQFLEPYFKNVKVFETIFPDRHNLYFWASDGEVPFSDN